MTLEIREAGADDRAAALDLHRAAFDGPDEAALTAALLDDPTAAPQLSLLAWRDGAPVGHVLLTAARMGDAPAAVLAPLAVAPAAQRGGIGGALVRAALARSATRGLVGVLVFGDPAYYGRFGFGPAAAHGVLPPHDPQPQWADAVMLATLGPVAPSPGRVAVAATLDDPALWVV
jgi:putative acetyltransferase